ncbi:MAG: hypothetical protein AAFP19_07055 [Bacteroidota bacterium]
MPQLLRLYFSSIPLLFFSLSSFCQDAVSTKLTFFDHLYKANSVQKWQLQTNMSKLISAKNEDSYHKGHLTIQQMDTTYEYKMRLRVRGRSRRYLCDLPPLKLEFRKKDLRKAGFLEIDDLKLVTHCQSSNPRNQAVVREYLMYRMYALLDSLSYRVQALKLRYIDTKNKQPEVDGHAFIIEPAEELAIHRHCELLDQMGMTFDSIDTHSALLFSLFQYMIGNTDWQLDVQRNLTIFRRASDGHRLLVPYDFDQSALVNTPYAKPNPNVGQTYLKQRVYMGPIVEWSITKPVVDLFLEQEKAFYDLIKQETRLSNQSKKEMTRYLNSFFKTIKNQKRLKRIIRQSKYL